jgi:hypothetical protein
MRNKFKKDFKPVQTKRWKRGKGALQRCLDDKGEDRFVVSREIFVGQEDYISREYNSFTDVFEFLKFRETDNGENAFHEILVEGQPCIEYYDIDGKIDDWKSIDHDEYCEILKDCAVEFVRLRREFGNGYKLEENTTLGDVRFDELIITQACNDTKLSLHIIIRKNKYFRNTKELGRVANDFQKWIKEKYPKSKLEIDTQVYSKNHPMRCVDSYKLKEPNRPFTPWGLSGIYIDKPENFFCSYTELFWYKKNDLGYTFTQNFLPHFVPKEKPKNVVYRKRPAYSLKEMTEKEKLCRYIVQKIDQNRSEGRKSWWSIGVSLYSTLNDCGRDIFHLFSKRSDKYDIEECDKTWEDIQKDFDDICEKYPYLNFEYLEKAFNTRKRIS